MARSIGPEGLNLIKEFEGLRLTAYKPVAAEPYWTIGYGHYGPDVKQGMTISEAQAEAYLREDVKASEACVNNPAICPVTAQLTQNQFDALVSFTYNCGSGSLKQLCRNGRTVSQIAEHLTAYNKDVTGKVLAGLVRRREAELKLYNTPDTIVVKTGVVQVDKRYNTLEEVPEWGRKTVAKLIRKGFLSGDGSGNMDLSRDMLRMLFINDRAGLYGE